MIKTLLISLLSIIVAAEEIGVYYADPFNSTTLRLVENDHVEAGFKYLKQCGDEWGVRFFRLPWIRIDTL